jgi:hypothetical protein
VCSHCRRPLRRRGGASPRFCAVCGTAVAHTENVEHRFTPGSSVEHRFAETPPVDWGGVTSLVAGLLAFTPACGFPLAAWALAFGLAAEMRRGARRTRRLGLAGALLGGFAMLLHLSCWGAFTR